MSQTKAQLLNPQGDFTLTGQLIGVGATFSGNVSIAGTLTKQDVTNVDSVGVVTARSGVNISGGNLQVGGTNVINSGLALYNLDSIKLADSKELKLGSSDDLKLYHNGSHSYIDEVGTGALKIKGDDIRFENASGVERLRILSDGKIGVGKTNPAEKLDVAGAIQVSSAGLKLDTHPLVSYASFTNISGGSYAARLGSTGSSTIRSTQIYGGGYPIATFDGVNTRLGIGSLAPTEKLDIVQNAADNVITQFRNLNQNSGNLIKFTQLTNGSVTNPIFYIGQGGDNTGDAWLNNAANTSLKFSTNNTERLRIGNTGQIGIAGANYGNAGQVLTSGGSGSIVAWADAAGGAEYSGIASGAISTGNPVMVHPDGKLAKVGLSWEANLSPSPADNGNLYQRTGTTISERVRPLWARQSDGTYSAGSSVVSFFYKSTSSYPHYETASVSGKTMTYLHQSGWNGGTNVGSDFDIAYNPDVGGVAGSGRVMLIYKGEQWSRPTAQIGRGPYSNGTWTWGSPKQLDSSNASQAHGLAYHGSDKFLATYSQYGTHYAQVLSISSSNSSTTVSDGARVQIESGAGNISCMSRVSDKDNNGKHIIFYAYLIAGSRYGIRYVVASISGTTVTLGTPGWVGGESDYGYEVSRNFLQTSFDPDQNRFNVVYEIYNQSNGGSSINKAKARNAIISGTSVTWSAQTQINTNSPKDGLDTVYDTQLKKHFVYQTHESSNKIIYNLINFTGSAAPTTVPALGDTDTLIYDGTRDIEGIHLDYDPTTSQILMAGMRDNDGDLLTALITKTATSETNLTSNNFLGFSKDNYTDGNTAKVLTLSSVSENQTGLTTATTYFVQPDGSLSTQPDNTRVPAGQAVSSTNLIVKSDNPRPGSLGHWTYALYNCGVFKPWCACGYASSGGGIVGAYECANSSCRYCVGRWNPYCCVQDNEWDLNLPTEAGGNMCLGCGGGSCNSAYGPYRDCCCCWPTGRFWFPEVGIYCYNLNMILSTCQGAPPSQGCWSVNSYFAVPKDLNRNCCNAFCSIDGYNAYSTSVCGYCSPQQAFDNVHIAGKVAVGDVTKNFMAFGIHKASMTNCVIVQNGINLRADNCIGKPNTVSFEKISNCTQITYCN